MTHYTLDIAGLSDVGMKRSHNEDAWSESSSDLAPKKLVAKGRLFVVADGVGGHLAGDIASQMAVEIIQRQYYADPSPDVAVSLTNAIQVASREIDREAATSIERRGMSTTVTAAVLHGDKLTVANVGDSRTYLIRNGNAHQLTDDHTWVEEQVRVGLITREEAAKHPQRNIITRSLGGSQELEVDIFEEHVEPGDRILLCSDGLSNMIPSQEIGAIVGQGKKAKTIVNKLIELAKQRGAPDNVTAVLLSVVQRPRGGSGRRTIIFGLLFASAVLLGGLALGMWVDGGGQEKTTPSQSPLLPDAFRSSLLSPLPPATAPPVDPSVPLLKLVRPAEAASLNAGEDITFTWEWNSEFLEDDEWFVLVVKLGQEDLPVVRRKLPLTQTQTVITEPLAPGRYVWTLTISGTVSQTALAGSFFEVIEPGLVPTAAP